MLQAKLHVLAGEGHVTVLLKHGAAILGDALHRQPAEAAGRADTAAEAGASSACRQNGQAA